MKKAMVILITILLLNKPILAEVGKLGAKGAVLIESDSKRILHSVKGEQPLPMASTTKIMTCILAIEKGNLEDIVTVSKEASKAPPVKLKLKSGEKQVLGDLLYSLMMESHNDTSVAIAEHIGGSVEEFCEMMTEKAAEIGANNTTFKTPNGLDADGHQSTPYDMALIASYALDNPKFVEIINTPNITIPTNPLEGSIRHDLINKNRFLHMVTGSKGVKTGYTSKAGHCFVGAAERNGMELIGVALGNFGTSGKSKKYTDVQKMIEYGFANYKPYVVLDKEQILDSVTVKTGKKESVQLRSNEQIKLPLTKDEVETVELSVTKPQEVEAPIKEDDEIGRVDVVLNGEVLASVPLYAEEKVEKLTIFEQIKKYIKSL
ncbi:hypothetical protein AN639_04545 [Candidatus Epulonipiscium fishelsonii]|uniref:Uncharacterized protein n=1 Tax=Candidatus Epulonipiscium fishelsonii TaxID=77094 RepID=A0ACC8XF12_9FIRM|nr:hypothetical protein AN639_04545 [Epulopiscium sp. SCG-B05WGA-EpuloA1]ONI41805.1 hypothetical protein AN396_03015 [Epulopiscium sp. SCG-B11WGA-EpuloA1]